MNRLIFEKQWLHFLGLVLLLGAVAVLARRPDMAVGEALGLDSTQWLMLAVRLAVAHQVLVWFCWRTELHAGFLSRTFGPAGFTMYAVAFSVVGIGRTLAVWMLAYANRGTLAGPQGVHVLLAVIALLPALFTFYSVRRWFGFRRAFGADHFDAAYRALPPVSEGAFAWTGNAMYTFGFLILWAPALWWGSQAGLLAAAFNHLYIWVHWFATERPDMARIYGDPDTGGS